MSLHWQLDFYPLDHQGNSSAAFKSASQPDPAGSAIISFPNGPAILDLQDSEELTCWDWEGCGGRTQGPFMSKTRWRLPLSPKEMNSASSNPPSYKGNLKSGDLDPAQDPH